MLSRFYLVPERNGQTDRFAISISRVSMLTRDKNRQTKVFATFRQGQPTKFVEQTSDRSCTTIIFFNKMGSTTLNSFELLDIFGHIQIPRCSGILQVGTN